MILVDFQARMEVVLKEMCQLVEQVDPNRAMDFSKFPELSGDLCLRTPVKPISDPALSESGRLRSLLGQTSMPFPCSKLAQPRSK